MNTISYIPSTDELFVRFRPVAKRPSKKIGRFKLWWDKEGNICAIDIKDFTREVEEFKKNLKLDCFVAYAPRNDTSTFCVIATLNLVLNLIHGLIQGKQSQTLKFLYLNIVRLSGLWKGIKITKEEIEEGRKELLKKLEEKW